MSTVRRKWRTARGPQVEPVRGRATRRGPHSPAFEEHLQVYEQGFRAEDESLERYELYVGVNGPPDFTASGQPVAESPVLPLDWTPVLPSSGTALLHCVVRYRNGFNLESFNVQETILSYVGGVLHLGPLTPPRELTALDRQPSSLLVGAKYLSVDDPAPADEWELYAKVGSVPVPGVDAPVFSSGSNGMEFLGVESAIVERVGPFTPGTTVYLVASVVRTVDGARASVGPLAHLVPPSLDLQEGFQFGGHAYQEQGPE